MQVIVASSLMSNQLYFCDVSFSPSLNQMQPDLFEAPKRYFIERNEECQIREIL